MRTTRASEVFGASGSRPRVAPAHVESPDGQTSDVRGRGEEWVHRHRRELVPLWVVLILAGVSELGHFSAPGLALLPLPAGILAALALAGWGARPIHRWGVPAAALAGVWVTAGWWWGIDNPAVLASLVLLGGTAVTVWWRHQHPRSRIEVVGGSPWPWRGEAWQFRRRARRELGNVAQVWPTIAERIGVPGARLVRMVADVDEGYELHVELARGQLAKDVKPDRLLSALSEFPADVHTPDPRQPRRIVLREQLEPIADELHDEGEPEPERPAETDVTETRLAMLLMAYQRAGKPLADYGAARASNLPRDWVWRVGRPTLAERGQLVQEGEKWAAR